MQEKHLLAASRILPTWSATWAYTLTGNRTSDILVRRLVLNPLSHTSQGLNHIFKMICKHFNLPIKLLSIIWNVLVSIRKVDTLLVIGNWKYKKKKKKIELHSKSPRRPVGMLPLFSEQESAGTSQEDGQKVTTVCRVQVTKNYEM